MRSTELKGVALLTIALALAACSSSKQMQPGSAMSQSPSAPAMSQSTPPPAMSQSMTSTRTGTFEGLNDKHVGGTAAVSDAQIVLSGFSSDAGPDLHIYLANGSDENAVAAGKEIGSIAFDKPSQTFSTSGLDASKYTTVVIHCDKAKAVFGAATLT
ncbi:DM13 domain-containing protein [Mycobacterium sp.]|uniref:DM13 domain-containing protein n=1 Tax=Mycobacterium sp. TaxID=1785 RepID=UPI003BB22356